MKGLLTKALAGLRLVWGELVLCDHSSAAGAGGMTGVPRETASKPASQQKLRPWVSQQGGAGERNTPISLSSLPPVSCWPCHWLHPTEGYRAEGPTCGSTRVSRLGKGRERARRGRRKTWKPAAGPPCSEMLCSPWRREQTLPVAPEGSGDKGVFLCVCREWRV